MTTPDPAAPVAGTDVLERAPRRSDELPAGSTAYWEALTDEMQGDIDLQAAEIARLRARVAELESERGELRTIVRVNALRHDPSLSHEEITAQLDRALRREPAPDPRGARIAELEAALREVIAAVELHEQEPGWVDDLRRALGDAHG